VDREGSDQRGVEYEKGRQYVYIEQEEIKKITPEEGRTMEILAFS